MLPRSWIVVTVICATFLAICRAEDVPSKADKIVRLPGQPRVGFQQYSGYVTIDEKQGRALFYYFVEAESHSALKPLALWLSGGPGCSSVGYGAFSEHGPFRPSGGGKLVRNDYSWNKEANMLYLESPAGVGFSYSANKSFYDSVNDNITAQDNIMFLQKWFENFPKYKGREFYITGESYAGHYVPQLAQLIVQSGLKFNLKGIGIGNPLLEFSKDLNSQGDFYWSHGLISDSTYELVNTVCNTSQILRESIAGKFSVGCETVLRQFSKEIPDAVDHQDVTADVCISPGQSQFGMFNPMLSQRFNSLKGLHSLQKAFNRPAKTGNKVDVCVEEKTRDYFNRKDVQEALHARLVGVGNWTFCSSVVHYEPQNLETPTIGVLGSLVSSGIRVLVYSGDQDSVIPFFGTRTLVNNLARDLGLNSTVPYRGWLQNEQVGGWTEVYGDILTFATIRGASHLAPFSSPERSLAVFTALITGKPLEGASANQKK